MKITESNFRMFQIYAREYKNLIERNDNDKLINIEQKMKNISEELTTFAQEFCKLDIEFKQNSNTIPDPIKYYMDNGNALNPFDFITNTSWEGFWKRCSGKDLEYFISYLEYPIIYPEHESYLENNKDLIKIFKEETGYEKVPYGVACAEKLNRKILKRK